MCQVLVQVLGIQWRTRKSFKELSFLVGKTDNEQIIKFQTAMAHEENETG
jgi:hypothetical protein